MCFDLSGVNDRMIGSMNYGITGDSTYLNGSSSRYNSISSRMNDNNAATMMNIHTIQNNIGSSYSNLAAEAYLASGDIDSAIAIYKATLADARNSIKSNYGYDLSDAQINSIAGNSLGSAGFMQEVMENTNGALMTGFLKGIPLYGFFAEKTSTQEAIAELNNSQVSSKYKAMEKLGGAIVPAITGAAAVAVGMSVGWIAGGIGLGLAALGLFSGLTDKSPSTTQA